VAVSTAHPYLRSLGSEKQLPLSTPKHPSHYHFPPDGKLLVVVSTQGRVAAFDTKKGGSALWTAAMARETSGGVFSHDSARFYLGDWQGNLVCFEARTGRELARVASPRMFDHAALLADGTLSIEHRPATSPASWHLYSPDLELLRQHALPEDTRRIIPDDEGRTAMVQLHEEVAVIEAKTKGQLKTLARTPVPGLYLGTIAAIDSQRVLATGKTEWRILDRKTAKPLHTLALAKTLLLGTSPDGKWVSLYDDHGGALLWETEALIRTCQKGSSVR
jgi:hypothetical protein